MTASSTSTINNHHSTIINPSLAMLCGPSAVRRVGFWTVLTVEVVDEDARTYESCRFELSVRWLARIGLR